MSGAQGWWKSQDPQRMKVLCMVVLVLLLVGSGIGLWRALSIPDERQETVTRVNYRHGGTFDYDVYVNHGSLYGLAQPAADLNPTYFRKLVADIDVYFSYEFVPQGQVEEVARVVTVAAVLENPGVWRKEIELVPETSLAANSTIAFGLDLEELQQLVDSIQDEIGMRSGSIDLTLRADVHVIAKNDAGTVEDDFSQTTKATLTATTLEWQPGLRKSQNGCAGGLSYSHQGLFDYAIHLKQNSLWGETTLRPPAASAEESPVALPVGQVYFPEVIDHVDGSFSYGFASTERLSDFGATVEVAAKLEYPGFWSRTFTLVPRTARTETEFTVTFPIDVAEFLEFEDVVRGEIGMGSASYDLTIAADVRMSADTEYGSIAGDFQHSLKGKLSGSTLAWTGDLNRSVEGSITETVAVANSVWPARGGAIAGLAVALVVGLLLVSSGVVGRSPVLSPADAEAHWARKKRKEILADVAEMPEPLARGMVSRVGSLDDLFRLADSLLKPVLHKAERNRHVYRVIDGLTTYEYVSEESGGLDDFETADSSGPSS